MVHTGPAPDRLNRHGFATERLIVDLPTQDDANALYHLVGGPDRRELCATLMWDGPDDLDEIRSWIDKCENETFEDFGYHWILRDRSGAVCGAGQAVGAMGTCPRTEPGRADVGYWLGRPYWGQGLMGEALRSLIDYGFATLDYYKIEADVFTNNERGIRLVESAGMTREGVALKAMRKYGEFIDNAVYGLLRENWSRPEPNVRSPVRSRDGEPGSLR